MDAWLIIIAIAVIGVVIGKLLYELNPAVWKGAAARIEDDTPPDGAIDDYKDLKIAAADDIGSPPPGALAGSARCTPDPRSSVPA
jgi:hypothetical protein